MNRKVVNALLLSSVWALSGMVSCNRNDGLGDDPNVVSGPDLSPRQFITLTAAMPDGNNTAGNGGTVAYALTIEEAQDPNYNVNIYSNGYSLRSQRTARVQGSVNGNFLYNIQYVGVTGGTFNKYRVSGANNFEDTNEELSVASILSAQPRWVKSAEGIGIGVIVEGASAPIDPVRAETGTQTYEYNRGLAKVAVINLDNPQVPNTTEFEFPFSDEEKAAGYAVGRIDMPVIKGNKVYIGCWLTKVDPNRLVRTIGENNAVTWAWAGDAANIQGSVTLVLNYPSLSNPRLIWSTQSQYGNNGYRSMLQHVGTDGNIYQATGVNTTGFPHILRIDGNSGQYDNTYLFNLSQALGTHNLTGIRAWRYLEDGKAIVLFTEANVSGGFIAMVDLNAKTATRLSTENQADAGFSGATNLTGTLTQFQNIAVAGDYAYIPMTPNGKEGNLYVINWRNGTIAKGARLTGQSGSFYIGAY